MALSDLFAQLGQGGPPMHRWNDSAQLLAPGQMAHSWEMPPAAMPQAPFPRPRPAAFAPGMPQGAPTPAAVSHNAMPAPMDPRVTAASPTAPAPAMSLADIMVLSGMQTGIPLLDEMWRRRG